MSVSGQRICRLAEEAASAPEPEDALETLTRLRLELHEFERQQVARALTGGRSFGDVARAMGISRQAAHRRFRDLARQRPQERRRLPPTPEVRLVFEYARAEATALGDSVLTPTHVLLGIMRNGDPRAASALTANGISIEDVRHQARALGGRQPGRPHDPRSPGDVDVRAVLAEAVRCARRDGSEHVEVEHLLRSALSNGDTPAVRVLRRLDVPTERVLARLDAELAAPPVIAGATPA
jgi:ATP-dependent Clp protease ATP-binding subunit ClpA